MFHYAVLLLIVFVNSNDMCFGPTDVDKSADITNLNIYKVEPNGDFNFKCVLWDGQVVDIKGKLIDVDGNRVDRVKGNYTVSVNDDLAYTIKYIADENHFNIYETFGIGAQVLTPDTEDEINPKTIAGAFG